MRKLLVVGITIFAIGLGSAAVVAASTGADHSSAVLEANVAGGSEVGAANQGGDQGQSGELAQIGQGGEQGQSGEGDSPAAAAPKK